MTRKLTGEMITYGKNFTKTIEIPSEVYGEEPDFKIAVDIKPISRKDMKAIFNQFGIKDERSTMDIEKADEMMVAVCKLGIVDPQVVAAVEDLLEFLPTKIGTQILELSTGSKEELENFSVVKKD